MIGIVAILFTNDYKWLQWRQNKNKNVISHERKNRILVNIIHIILKDV